MKYTLAIIIVLVISGALWFAAGTWRRSSMLDSGRPILLVNSSNKTYTYSDLLDRDEITRDYKFVGFYDELTAQEIAEITAGYHFFAASPIPPGDPRGIAVLSADFVLPTADQQSAWARLVATLTASQQSVCASISESAASQYCLARHAVFNAWKSQSGAGVCAMLYVESQKTECERDLAENSAASFTDSNNNQLIDAFEDMAQPAAERMNERALPIINPVE